MWRQRPQTETRERLILCLHSRSDLRHVRPISEVEFRPIFQKIFDAAGCVDLVHGILRDMGAMSAQSGIRVDVRKSREISTVKCAFVRLALTGINFIGALKMIKDVHRVQSIP